MNAWLARGGERSGCGRGGVRRRGDPPRLPRGDPAAQRAPGVIVYGSRESVDSTAAIRARLSDLAVRADLDATVEALILAGELEAGVVDAWTGDTDDDDPRFEVLRALSVGFARRMVAAWDGRTPPPVRMDRLFTQPLPESIRVTVPEGYAWYALYPQTRAEAARAFAREIGPSDAVVVGIRSIRDQPRRRGSRHAGGRRVAGPIVDGPPARAPVRSAGLARSTDPGRSVVGADRGRGAGPVRIVVDRDRRRVRRARGPGRADRSPPVVGFRTARRSCRLRHRPAGRATDGSSVTPTGRWSRSWPGSETTARTGPPVAGGSATAPGPRSSPNTSG